MDLKELKKSWVYAERTSFKGWDFSYIKDSTIEELLPWSYDKIVREHLKCHHKLLDMGTGGGEYLLSLNHPYQNTFVTESYLPNIEYCKTRLSPLGITVNQVFDDSNLPYEDGFFDVIINRHESFVIDEVYRLLKPDGYFITQQVGGKNNIELSKFLIEDFSPQYENHSLKTNIDLLLNSGFKILKSDEFFPRLRFLNIEALVYLCKIIEWEFPNFSVEKCFDKLYALYEKILKNGYIETTQHRFFMICKKP